MKAALVALLVAAFACSDKNDNPTPVGTTIVQWDHTQSERASMKTAKIGERKSSNIAHRAKLVDGSVVELGVQLVTAPVTLFEDGVTKEYTAPVLVIAKLDKNADFTFSNAKCMGPHYQRAVPTPREMILECRAQAKKPTAEVFLAFDIFGDGRIADAVPAPSP